MIIDIHAHTSNHPLWNLHTTSATIDTLEHMAQKHAIHKIAIMATYFPFKGTGLHNVNLYTRIASHDRFLMFGSLDASKNICKGIQELEEFLSQKKIVGIKLYPGYQKFHPADKKMHAVYALAQKYHVPIMFHCGELHHCCPENIRKIGKNLKCGKDYCPIDALQDLARPSHITKIAQQFSNVQFIASHLGNPYFEELRDVMRQCPNVSTDISGQFISDSEESSDAYKKEIVHEIHQFLSLPHGIDRILFGTDFPIQSYADSIDLIKALHLPHEDETKIFYTNACKILRISH